MVMRKNIFFVTVILIIPIFVLFANSLNWQGREVNYTTFEEEIYFHNLTLNVSGYNRDIIFEIAPTPAQKIKWTNNSGTYEFESYENSPISAWIKILNSSEGILKINSTLDRQTGFFEIPIKATNISSGSARTDYFYFIINATNDAPVFSGLRNVSNPYNTSLNFLGNSFFNISFSASDEEEHYPISISNLSFLSCLKALWTNQTNCSLQFSFSGIGNTNLILNFTNLTSENVGLYNLSVCIKDNINSTNNYPLYRVPNYNENKTSCQSFSLNILYYLSINSSNCSGLSLTEGENLSCYVNITTKESSESFYLWSKAFLNFTNSTYYINQLTKEDWFYPLRQNFSENFFKQIFINITNLTKRNVGNWTINLNSNLSDGSFFSQNITLFINKTNYFPKFNFNFSIENNKTSVNSFSFFNFSFYDEDFLIPDKNFYNETINLTIRVFNKSNPTQEVFWQNFSKKVFVYQGNSSYSNQSLIFTPNLSHVGNWTINFSYVDMEGNSGFEIFDLEIINNEAPKWNQSFFYLICFVNSTKETTNPCIQNVNLTNFSNGLFYAYDLENDSLIFSFDGEKPFNFNLTSNGILNFNPWKEDVSIYRGNWDFNLSVSDGYLFNSSLRLVINVSNINSPPRIMNLSYPLSIEENNFTLISFRVYDDDLLIPFYYYPGWLGREANFSLSKTSFSPNTQNLKLSDFSNWFDYISQGYLSDNSFPVNFSFTPNKSNVGNHTINISVMDKENFLNWTSFNITVLGINNQPTFNENISNFSSAIGRNFYLKVNASDEEDGDDTVGNLSFNYSLLRRLLFGRYSKNETRIFDCIGCFNSTSGIFNLSLNQSHAGFYVINVSVADRGFSDKPNKTSWQIFWLFVYDYPNITYPEENFIFNFSENSTQIFNFSVNHSIGNNLTYFFYIDGISCSYQNSSNCSYSLLSLKEMKNFSGNGSNVSWTNYFGFDEETYGNLKNLTLIVYPSDSNLDARELINSSKTFKLNITHVNSLPNISFIGSRGGTYGSANPIIINLSQHVFDYDNADPFYRENLTYFVNSSSDRSEIYLDSTYSGANLLPKISFTPIINLYALKSLTEEIFVVVNDSLNNSVRSNNFSVIFTEPSKQQVPIIQSSGGGSSIKETKFVSLSIKVPSLVKARVNEILEVPVSIKNTGELRISSISLGSGFKQPSNENISINLSSNFIDFLEINQEKNLSLSLRISTNKSGTYSAYVNVSSNNPRIFQEANFYIEIYSIPGVNVEEVLVFTEKLLTENPECAELRERIVEINNLKEKDDYEKAFSLANEVVESCKKSISQKRNFILFQREVPKVLFYLFSSLVLVFVVFLVFYIYKRVKFNKSIKEEYV